MKKKQLYVGLVTAGIVLVVGILILTRWREKERTANTQTKQGKEAAQGEGEATLGEVEGEAILGEVEGEAILGEGEKEKLEGKDPKRENEGKEPKGENEELQGEKVEDEESLDEANDKRLGIEESKNNRSEQEKSKKEELEEEKEVVALKLADIRKQKANSIVDTSLLTSDLVDSLFYAEEISDGVFERISNCSYVENTDITVDALSYIRVLHIGFDGNTHIGELIVNEKIADDIIDIMKELYDNFYPIEKMVLVDEYGADDELSMADNNTSAFNYRVIAGTTRLSKHSLGLAIDINPMYNPYVRHAKDRSILVEPLNGTAYVDRAQEFAYKIDTQDLSYRLFTEHGFTWGGDWNTVKDYQHFQKEVK
ncbi:M15 family metallopeptidase [Lachnospiraceae bacterium ZAX-1]